MQQEKCGDNPVEPASLFSRLIRWLQRTLCFIASIGACTTTSFKDPGKFLGCIGRDWECVKDLGAILYPYRVSVILLIALPILFTLDQSQDAFRAIVQDHNGDAFIWLLEKTVFFAACVLWAFQVFYWARFMSRLKLPNPPAPPVHYHNPPVISAGWASSLKHQLPRYLGMIAGIEVIVAVNYANYGELSGWDETSLFIASFALVLTLYFFIWKRRTFLRWIRVFTLPSAYAPDLDPTQAYAHAAGRSQFAFATYKHTRNWWPESRWIALVVIGLTLALFLIIPAAAPLLARPAAVACAILWLFGGLYFIWTVNWMPRGMQWWVTGNLVLVLLLFGISVYPEQIVGQFLSSPSIIISVGAAWVFIGTLAIVYPAEWYKIPVAAIVVVTAIFFSIFFEDNHGIRMLPKTSDPALQNLEILTAIRDWQTQADTQRGPDGRIPLIIVTTAGGASRASYWTATVLGHLEQDIRGFHRHVFAISAVSGGSLGAATWRALVEQELEDDGVTKKILPCAQGILRKDYLSPAFLTGFYADLAQRFLPGHLLPDRAMAIEDSWKTGWSMGLSASDCNIPAAAKRFADPFHYRNNEPANNWLPLLLFNGTSEKSGRRIITSELKIDSKDFPDAIDFFGETGAEVSYATAIHNSARFPYIDAAGTIFLEQKGKEIKTDRIVDGGYFENFGAATGMDLEQTLREQCNHTQTCNFDIHVIQISSDPDLKQPARRDDEWHQKLDRSLNVASDITVPLVTFFNTRDGVGYRGTNALRRQIDIGDAIDKGVGNYVHFHLTCERTGTKTAGSEPMSWALSDRAVEALGKTEWCSPSTRSAITTIEKWFSESKDSLEHDLDTACHGPDRSVVTENDCQDADGIGVSH